MFLSIGKRSSVSKAFSVLLLLCFVTNLIFPNVSYAQSAFNLPAPGTMISTSPAYMPTMIKGLQLSPTNPLAFNFIVDTGNSKLQGPALKEESGKLIRYFLSALTVPEQDLWVNLSPYEKDRIIANGLGQTEMGRDMLAQDYILKQLTASLVYPEGDLGKKFWAKVKKQAKERFGTDEIPLNTFNKVWIVPQQATVYEKNGVALVVENKLKVMLEEDYVAMQKTLDARRLTLEESSSQPPVSSVSNVTSQIVREIVIPELEKEVNTGKHFANLRQITNAVLLAYWYKQNLKNTILSQVYVDKNKVKGVDVDDKNIKMKIYEQYLEAFKKGAYSYIKEEYDAVTDETVAKKYFSGGAVVKYSPDNTRVIHSDEAGRVSSAAAAIGETFEVDALAVENVTKQNAAQFEPKISSSAVVARSLVYGQTDNGKSINVAYADLYSPVAIEVLNDLIRDGVADNIKAEDALIQQKFVERAQNDARPGFLPTRDPHGNLVKIRYSDVTVEDARTGNFEGPKDIPADLKVQDIHLTGNAAKSPADKQVNKDGTPMTEVDQQKADIRNAVHALRSGANGWMADNEDALGAAKTTSLDNIRALLNAFKKTELFWEVAREIYDQEFSSQQTKLTWEEWRKPIDENKTTRIFRPRGGHLDDRHVKFMNSRGELVALPAIMADLVTYLTNVGPVLVEQKSTPTVYIPKTQSAAQAALYKQVIAAVEKKMGWEEGTVKVIVLIEQLPAMFQLAEIRAVLGKNFLGFDSGRWDYIASVIKQMSWKLGWTPPNFTEMIMTYPFLSEAEKRIYQAVMAPDKNGNTARWFGGMEPQIPVVKGQISEADKAAAIENAMKIAEVSKLREALGLGADQMENVRALLPLLLALPEDQSLITPERLAPIIALFQQMGVSRIRTAATWVAHPGMVERLQNVYTKLRVAFSQIEYYGLQKELPVETIAPLQYNNQAAERLVALKPEAEAVRTVAEARFLVSVAIQYVNAYLTGRAAAALKGADLFSDPSKLFIMEDMATGEGRAQLSRIWWKHAATITTLTDVDRAAGITSNRFSRQMMEAIITQEFDKLKNAPDDIVFGASKEVQLPIAEMVVREFITGTVDYPWLIDLANQVLDETDVKKAKAKIENYRKAYQSSNGRERVTQNPQFAASVPGAVKPEAKRVELAEKDRQSTVKFETNGTRASMYLVDKVTYQKTEDGPFNGAYVARTAAASGKVFLNLVESGEWKLVDPAKGMRVLIAYDARKGAAEYAQEAYKALAAYKDLTVHMADGVTTSPDAAYQSMEYDFVLQITASHNPENDNGIKVFTGGIVVQDKIAELINTVANSDEGRAGYFEMAYDVSKITFVNAFEKSSQRKIKAFTSLVSLVNMYLHPANGQPKAKLYVDLMGGAASRYAPLFENLGMTVFGKEPMSQRQYVNRKGGLYEPNPTKPENFGPEFDTFKAEAPDGSIWFGLDGDVDRLVVWVKQNGKAVEVNPNDLGMLYADNLITKLKAIGVPEGKQMVIAKTLPTTLGLDLVAKKHGIPIFEVPVGSKNFRELLENPKYIVVVATEESGHQVLTINGQVFFDDAVTQLYQVITMMGETRKNPAQLALDLRRELNFTHQFYNTAVTLREDSQFINQMQTNPQVLIDAVEAKVGQKAAKILVVAADNSVQPYRAGIELKADQGLYFLFENSRFGALAWFKFRKSGTEPKVRIYREVETPAAADEILAIGQEIVGAQASSAVNEDAFEDAGSTASAPVDAKNVGGINLDPKLFNMQIKRDGNGIPLPIIQQPLNMNIEGFFPVILNITPVNVVPLLGFDVPANVPEVAKLSSL